MEIYSQIINILLIILLVVGIVLGGMLIRFIWNATLLVKAMWADLEVLIETLRTTNSITEEIKAKMEIVNDALPIDSALGFLGSIINLIMTWRRGKE